MSIYVLSARGLDSSVSWDTVFELEDLLVRTCDGQLLVPTARSVTQWAHEHPMYATELLKKAVRRTTGLYKLPDNSFQSQDRPKILLIIAISGADLTMLSSIPGWREKFDIVAAYIFDAWDFPIYPKYTRNLDRLFVAMPELIDDLQKYFGIPVSLVPFGADILTHGSGELNRPFDLVSYGRIPEQYHRAFTNTFNPRNGANLLSIHDSPSGNISQK